MQREVDSDKSAEEMRANNVGEKTVDASLERS